MRSNTMSDKDDCISRQEALKICRRYWHPTYNPIMEEIEKLPSVQPEHKTMAKKEAIEKIKEIIFNKLASVWTIEDAYAVIQDMPTKEPDIIRCRDCKHAHITTDSKFCKYCDQFKDDNGELIEMYFNNDFFCGYAERKEEQ